VGVVSPHLVCGDDTAEGDLLEAEVALDAIIGAARETHDGDTLGRALHERGMVAYESNQVSPALAFFREAAAAYPDQRMRRRALTDVAMVLGEQGRSTAHGARIACSLMPQTLTSKHA
jgi:hypothetical protein